MDSTTGFAHAQLGSSCFSFNPKSRIDLQPFRVSCSLACSNANLQQVDLSQSMKKELWRVRDRRRVRKAEAVGSTSARPSGISNLAYGTTQTGAHALDRLVSPRVG